MAPLPRAALLAALTLLPLVLAGSATSNHTPWGAVASADVVVVGTQFAPEVLVVSPGQTVTFRGGALHSAVSDDNANLLVDGGDGATFNLPGATGSWTVPSDAGPGVLLYYCRPHALFGMRGVILVV